MQFQMRRQFQRILTKGSRKPAGRIKLPSQTASWGGLSTESAVRGVQHPQRCHGSAQQKAPHHGLPVPDRCCTSLQWQLAARGCRNESPWTQTCTCATPAKGSIRLKSEYPLPKQRSQDTCQQCKEVVIAQTAGSILNTAGHQKPKSPCSTT